MKSAVLATLVISFLWAFTCLADDVPRIKVAATLQPPYIDFENGEYKGIHVDVLKMFAEQLKHDLTFIQCPFARCLSMLKSGETDLYIGLIKTKEREKFLTYIPKPFNIQYDPLKFFLNKNKPLKIESYDDLKPLNIGVLRGVSYFQAFDKDTSLNKVELLNYQQLLRMLLRGRIDTFIEREESITPWVDPATYQNNIIIADYEYNKGVNSYIAVSKKSIWSPRIEELLSVQEALIKAGKIHRIQPQE